jgi:hypothetical protein
VGIYSVVGASQVGFSTTRLACTTKANESFGLNKKKEARRETNGNKASVPISWIITRGGTAFDDGRRNYRRKSMSITLLPIWPPPTVGFRCWKGMCAAIGRILKNQTFNTKTSYLVIMTSSEQRRSLDEFEDDFDPDLDISKGKDKVWLVKLPKWLMEHWAKADQDNVELAKIKIPYAYPS